MITVPRFNVQRLRDDNAVANEFSIALKNKFDALVNLPGDVDAAWAEVTKVYHSTATEIIGFRKFHKKPWLTDETLQVLEDKATARKRHNTTERRRLQGVFRAKAKEDRERYYNNLADDVEEGLLRNDRPAYAAVCQMKGSSTAHITPVRKKGWKSVQLPRRAVI